MIIAVSYLLGIVTMSIPLISTEWYAMVVWNVFWATSLALSGDAEEAWLFNEITYNKNSLDDGSMTNYQQTYGILLATALVVSGMAEIFSGMLVTYSLEAPFMISIFFMLLSMFWIMNIPEHRMQPSNSIQNNYSNTKNAFNSLMSKSLLLFMLIYIIFSAIANTIILWVQVYLNTKNVEMSSIGIIFGIATLFYCSGVMLSARYIRKTGNFSSISVLIIIGMGIILMGISPVIITLGILFLIQMVRGISAPYFKIKIIEETPTSSRTTALSIIGTISTIIGLLIELTSSIYLTHNSFESYFIISGLLVIMCIPLAIIWQIFNRGKGNSLLQQENMLNNYKTYYSVHVVESKKKIVIYMGQTSKQSLILPTIKILYKIINIAKKRLKKLRLCFGLIPLYQANIKVWTTIHRESTL